MIQACGACGTEFETLQGKYAPDGSIVCLPCGERMAVATKAAEKQTSGSAFPGSIGGLLVALVSFVVENRFIFFLFPLAAIAIGVGTAYTALKNEQARQALGWKRVPTVIIGITAALLALLSLALSMVGRLSEK